MTEKSRGRWCSDKIRWRDAPGQSRPLREATRRLKYLHPLRQDSGQWRLNNSGYIRRARSRRASTRSQTRSPLDARSEAANDGRYRKEAVEVTAWGLVLASGGAL